TTTAPRKLAQPQYQIRFGCSSASSAFHRGASDGSVIRMESRGSWLSAFPDAAGEAETVRTSARPARLMSRMIFRSQLQGNGCGTNPGGPRASLDRERADVSDRLGLHGLLGVALDPAPQRTLGERQDDDEAQGGHDRAEQERRPDGVTVGIHHQGALGS